MNVSAPNNTAQKKHVKNSLAELFFLNNHKGFFRAYVVYRSTFFALVRLFTFIKYRYTLPKGYLRRYIEMKKEPTLGEIIKEERIAQRFTQEEIAERIGCHPQYYKNLENDKATPSLRMYKKIMRTLNISSDSYIHPESQTDNPLYDKIVRLLHKCSPELLSVVLATTEALLALSHDSQDNTEK